MGRGLGKISQGFFSIYSRKFAAKHAALWGPATPAPYLTLETASRLATPAHPLIHIVTDEVFFSPVASIT